MIAQNEVRPRWNAVAAAITRFVRTRNEARDRRNTLGDSELLRIASAEQPAEPDPVSVAVFAIDRVGPAAVRACASGVEVRVNVADAATAAVLRAALIETARRRPTDRLIHVVSEDDYPA